MAKKTYAGPSGQQTAQTFYETHSKDVAFAYAKDGFVEVSNRYRASKTIDRAVAHAVRRGIKI